MLQTLEQQDRDRMENSDDSLLDTAAAAAAAAKNAVTAYDVAQLLSSNSNASTNGANANATKKTIEFLLSEKNDENFHKHGLVRHIRKQIDGHIGAALDRQLSDPDTEARVAVATIMSSQEYATLLNAIIDQVRISVSELSSDAQKQRLHKTPAAQFPTSHQFNSSRTANTQLNSHRRLYNTSSNLNEVAYHHSFSTHSNVTNESSSGSLSSSFVSPHIEEVKLIVANLQSKNAGDLKLAAAQKFNLLSTADLISSEFWSETKCGIETALNDNDYRISAVGLRICAKVFKSSPPSMTGEVFLILVQHLITIFEAGNVPTLETWMDPHEPKFGLLVKKFRLLLQFQLELPSCWLRFPDQLFCNTINASFRLLKQPKGLFHPISGSSHVTALQMMGFVDPTAQWFEKWTLSSIGRAQSVVAILKADLATEFASFFVMRLNNIPFNGENYPVSLQAQSCRFDLTNTDVLVMDVDAGDEGEKDIGEEQLGSKRGQIPAWDIEYIQFLHVAILLSKLVRSDTGRNQIFPLSVDVENCRWVDKDLARLFHAPRSGGKLILSVQLFVQVLAHLVCKSPRVGPARIDFDDPATADALFSSLHLSSVVCRLLKEIASTVDDTENIFTEFFMEELISPLQLIMEPSSNEGIIFNERTLLNMSATLSSIAATNSSQKIYFRDSTVLASVKIVVCLVQECFAGTIQPTQSLTPKVLGAFIFFLRQLYRTCRGIEALCDFDLHASLATNRGNLEWFQTWNSQTRMGKNEWEAHLVDNLLNFAATPKGVMKLVEAEVMDDCAKHMFQRYQKKLQVSACEKFGYGVLMSQISVTGPGMKALYQTGIISALIQNVWLLLEPDCVFEEPTIDIDDSRSLKVLSSLLKSVSTFAGLSALLDLEDQGTVKKEDTLVFLLRALIGLEDAPTDEVFVDCAEGHQVGLRILSNLITSLDSCVLLQQKFRFIEALMQQQSFAQLQGGEYIVDPNTILRNRILVSAFFCGAEKRIPGDSFGDLELFHQYPCPDVYMGVQVVLSIDAENKDVLSMKEKLMNPKYTSKLLPQMEKQMQKICKVESMSTMPIRLVSQMLSKMTSMMADDSMDKTALNWKLVAPLKFEEPHYERWQIPYQTEIGIAMAVRYAKRLIPSLNVMAAKRDFAELMMKLSSIFKSKVVKQRMPGAFDAEKQFCGFDWFAATLFIINECALEKTWEFLHAFKHYAVSLFAWSSRSLAYMKQNPAPTIPLIYSCSCHFIEFILEAEFPSVFNAFTLSGCSPSQITERWLRECMWTVLPFPEIIHYTLTILLSGADYQIYYCISLFKHLEKHILLATTRGDLLRFLTGDDWAGFSNAMQGYRGADSIEYMKGLEVRYRDIFVKDVEKRLLFL
ncbi:hypothetical protein HDU81_010379 [Chytriomyces hyalinus]|nr:hypothetical protein HDU81_010379 [Chytriomyces hyalinus]